MKLWQLSSLLRWGGYSIGHPSRDRPDWTHFEQWFLRIEQLVDSQDREKLDAELPDEFVRVVLTSVDIPFRVDHEGWVRGANRSDSKSECLSALEAFERFGGEILEDALEKGVSHTKLFPTTIADGSK
ncbi:MAG: hypothetical protein R3C30_09880 [Hyphomonadaceae bacterium]